MCGDEKIDKGRPRKSYTNHISGILKKGQSLSTQNRCSIKLKDIFINRNIALLPPSSISPIPLRRSDQTFYSDPKTGNVLVTSQGLQLFMSGGNHLLSDGSPGLLPL
ncbi:hypothetical protein EVAR_72876_1 [Eumeta japonica]|uniref:Uncharacterized protein n=1 Tax=Eumeta variegata TaxID=151549 RepID=A0A4C2ABQ9_EUMVA|nr:hypothetical protein EVAR_72876_1 [Eumeta japonica]